jgi:hypothetical protein
MGQGELFALDADTFRSLLALTGTPSLLEFVHEIEDGWSESYRLPCWKSWPELHKCLTGIPSEPLRECFLGNRYLTDPNGGYIVAVLMADKVPGLASALASLDVNWLRGQCEQLFPNDDPDDWVAELAEMLATVREFYQHAAASGRSVLFTSDELLKDIYPPSNQA